MKSVRAILRSGWAYLFLFILLFGAAVASAVHHQKEEAVDRWSQGKDRGERCIASHPLLECVQYCQARAWDSSDRNGCLEALMEKQE